MQMKEINNLVLMTMTTKMVMMTIGDSSVFILVQKMLNKKGRRDQELEGRLVKILVIKNEEEKGITDNKHNIQNKTN
jgi:hypothetical protein